MSEYACQPCWQMSSDYCCSLWGLRDHIYDVLGVDPFSAGEEE